MTSMSIKILTKHFNQYTQHKQEAMGTKILDIDESL